MIFRARSDLLRSGIRRLRSFSTVAGDTGAGGELSSGERVVAAALAAAGSGLAGFLLLPSYLPNSSSSLSFADSGDGDRSDLDRQISLLEEASGEMKPTRFLLKDSFRRRVFFNYEKRIRLQSPPEKIFEYFATVKNSEGEIFMLPADLMRAVVPVFPPSESNRVREGSLRGERQPGELHCAPSEFFMLFDTNNDGLISFSEYIFFVTLLSIPESSFSVAFKMFDVDNSGEIEREEFKKVMALMRTYNRQGATHRNGLRPGFRVSRSVENSGIVEYFFGRDGNGKLKYETFVDFLRGLHEEIVRLEFAHYDYKSSGTISAKDFALSMVTSADLNHINKLLDRVDDLSNQLDLKETRFTYEEFKAFSDLRTRLEPLAMAIFSYGKVNGWLTKQDFIRAAYHVCGVSLSEKVVDVIFHVFDTNGDGNLSSEEFLHAMERCEMERRQPVVTGGKGFLPCLVNCTRSSSSLSHLPHH